MVLADASEPMRVAQLQQSVKRLLARSVSTKTIKNVLMEDRGGAGITRVARGPHELGG